MALIAPFRGLRYNPEKAPDLSRVVIPPYDVISPTEQDIFYSIDPHNMIRLELGKTTPSDTEGDNSHTRAAACMREWRTEGVLVREDLPSLYYYELDYLLPDGSPRTRFGFLCLLRLEEFGSGAVRPHEKTFKEVKDERLGLMQACHANLSPVFALYADPSLKVDETLRSGRAENALMDFRDRCGKAHRIWRVSDIGVLRQVKDLMLDKPIFIADGHHRYETAINYRAIQRDRHPNLGPNAPFEYIMMYLSNLAQEGLTILPTHRVVRSCEACKMESFLIDSAGLFDLSSFRADEAGRTQWLAKLDDVASRKEIAIGFYRRGGEAFHVFQAKRGEVCSILENFGVPEALRRLDVVVLDQIILKRLLELPEMFQGNERNIQFKHDSTDALDEIRSGKFEAGFFINSTRIEQVQEVATAGLIMPHKSTYFYPKVGSGLVINPLSPDEQIVW